MDNQMSLNSSNKDSYLFLINLMIFINSVNKQVLTRVESLIKILLIIIYIQLYCL